MNVSKNYIRENFESDLFEQPISIVANKYLFDNFPYCFKEAPEKFSVFREEICTSFNIHPKNFCIVGSGKTGFSLNPKKYGKIFDYLSDIDVVLISEDLFQKLWLELIEFKKSSLYRLSPFYKKRFNELQSIIFFGIIRLDKLSNDFDFAKDWWDFFNKLSKNENYGLHRVRGAIFKSWQHVSIYYEYSLDSLKSHIEVKYESNGI